MKKRMFSKFTNILHQAVEALAPQVPLQEEFVYHWKSVTTYFMDNKGDKIPVDQTSIPGHLNQMVVLLQEEETDTEKGATGPCMEYLLQHKLLETLYSLGRTDHPPGMKQVVLSFFTKLLSRLNHPLLPHVSVHRAVHRMVRACGEVKAAPSETEEIQFLCTVCAKIKEDPYLVNFFIEVPKTNFKVPGAAKPVGSHSIGHSVDTKPEKLSGQTEETVPVHTSHLSSENEVSNKSSHLVEDDQPQYDAPKPKEKPKQEFSLVNSLIMLCRSPDSRVAVKACEGLMLCASLPEQSSAQCIVEDTAFCTELSQRLVESYLKLPSFVNPASLELVEAKWGLDVITESEDQQTFLGKRHLVSFLSWLDYCDQLINIANPVIGNALGKSIRNLFLDVIMEPSILQTSETGAILATAYMCRCLRTVNSQPLLKEFATFLLGTSREPTLTAGKCECSVRKRLIERCNHLSEELCLVTLKLFDILIQKDDDIILSSLVLWNLIGRGYYNKELILKSNEGDTTGQCADSTNVVQSSTLLSQSKSEDANDINEQKSPEEVKIENIKKAGLVDRNDRSPSLDDTVTTGESNTASLESTPKSSPGKARPEVHKIVNSFLTLLPEDLKSSYQTADSGYDMYLRDAHKQFKDISMMCQPWNWSEYPQSDVQYRTEVFYEGDFLEMLLDKLTHMLDQSYAVNLQVTSLMSKLALLPHPNLSEFLLDPFLPTHVGVRNLFSVLKKVAHEISVKLSSDLDLGQRLVVARKQLMGLAPNVHRLEGQSQLEAIIVMEEFCKELSAIAFVKHHAAVTRS